MRKMGGSKIILVVLMIFILLISLYIAIDNILYPKITLKEGDLIIGLNSKYVEPGYTATYKGDDITENVNIEGKVNTKKLGVYNINYSVIEGSKIREANRKVYVKDLEKPKIELSDDNDIYVCPDKSFVPPKYKAYDNIDKDITNKVKVIRKGASISYMVKDSSGNETIINKKIHFKDIEGPTIKFKSNDNIAIPLNSNYDNSYTISDNCDKNIDVKVSGKVDTSTPGEYIIKYQAIDKYGNETIKERRINVFKKGQKGTVYLTFDDGPREGTTDKILDILNSENVKATFFVTNSGPDNLIKREFDEGHTVGLHTASHNYSYIYSSIENYFNDLQSVHDRVYRITGYDSKIIRFPGGSSNTISRRYKKGIMSELTKEVVNRGYKYYDWNVLSGDAGDTTDSKVVYQMTTEKLSKDKVNIVLMHDIKPYTVNALKDIIKFGKENGYLFDSLDNNNEMLVQKVNN